jgi:alpha-glucosidase
VPIPWAGDAPPFGFSPDDATGTPWLPQPAHWRTKSVAAQTGDPSSTLELYRAALRLHGTEPGLGDGTMTWLESPPGVLAFRREGRFACVTNLSAATVALPAYESVLLSSAPLEDGCLPSDASAWIRLV